MASNNPFNFSKWLQHEIINFGGNETGDDVELGRANRPDYYEGTHILGYTPNNAAFAGMYRPDVPFQNEPGVGVFGQGLFDRGIGVEWSWRVRNGTRQRRRRGRPRDVGR